MVLNSSFVDIDECARGLSNCHKNAVCKNTVGSFTCTCNMDSVGDGRTCISTKYSLYKL